jgi:K+ transporter
VLPVSVLILVALFAIQPQGTARIGRAFGPIMAIWFATIALLHRKSIAKPTGDARLTIDPHRAANRRGFFTANPRLHPPKRRAVRNPG